MSPVSERRLRVLAIADSCNPEWESTPLVGWSHANALRELADVHIVTRNWNRDALLRAGLVEGTDFTALDTEALFKPMERLVRKISGPNKGWALLTALTIPSYLWLEQLLWRKFAARLRAGEFDVVHRITSLSPAVPSLIGGRLRRIGVPFVLGPLNGGLPWPPTFPDLKRRDGEWLSSLREAYRALPGYAATRRSANAIMVGGGAAMTDLAKRYHHKAIYVPENGLELSRFPMPPPRTPESYRNRPLRAVFLGRLVPAKGADMLVEAIAPLLADGRMTLEIIGFGPEREAVEQLASRLGVLDRIVFAGKISHHDVAVHVREADVFTFPSVHEFGGAVVLEAMAVGVVPVIVQYGGPAELVSPASGFAIPMGTRPEVIAGMRAALEQLVQAPEQLAPMSAQAVHRARTLFAWPAKARQTYEVYRWVLGQRPDKPDFGLPFPDPVEQPGEAAAPALAS